MIVLTVEVGNHAQAARKQLFDLAAAVIMVAQDIAAQRNWTQQLPERKRAVRGIGRQ